MKKKDENRFTIRFNPADPRQQMVRDALAASGRRKAALLTDAVYEYLIRHGGDGTSVAFQPALTLTQIPTPSALLDSAYTSSVDIAENKDAEVSIEETTKDTAKFELMLLSINNLPF